MPSVATLGERALAFVDKVGRLETCREVARALRREIEPLGLTYIACGAVSGPRMSANPFYFLDWPEDWFGLYAEENFVAIDPVPRWARTSRRSIAFSEVRRLLPSRDPARKVYEAARGFQIKDGVALPVETGDGGLGAISIAGDRDGFAPGERAFLEVVATAAMLRAVAIGHDKSTPKIEFGLTKRELDCLALLVRGLGDRDVARNLGISETTARFHLDNARRKTGAASRAHLAALAVHLGLARL